MKPKFNHSVVFCTLSVVILCLGLLDAQIPREVTFFVIYLVPLCTGAYLLSARSTILLAIIASLTWMVSDHLTNPSYSHYSIFLWNFAVRSAAFFGAGAIIQYFREALDRKDEIIEEYKSAAQEVTTFDGSHLLCDSCGRLASQHDRWLTPSRVYHREIKGHPAQLHLPDLPWKIKTYSGRCSRFTMSNGDNPPSNIFDCQEKKMPFPKPVLGCRMKSAANPRILLGQGPSCPS